MAADLGNSASAAAPQTGQMLHDHHVYAEKRQLFLRSYQFSKKPTTATACIRSAIARIGHALSARLRAARRIRRVLWSRVRRNGCCGLRLGHRRGRVFRSSSSLYTRRPTSSW